MSAPSTRTPQDVVPFYKCRREPDVLSASRLQGDSLQSWNARLGALSLGSSLPDLIRVAGPINVSIVESVTICVTDLAGANMNVSLPDPLAMPASEGGLAANGFIKTILHFSSGIFTLNVTDEINGVVTAIPNGQSSSWIYEGHAWIPFAGSATGGGGGGSVTLAETLHQTAIPALGQEPTTSGLFPQPTAIEGLRATLNLDLGSVNLPERFPSLAGFVGPIGITGVENAAGAGGGQTITIRGGAGTLPASSQGGGVNLISGDGILTSGPINVTTGSGPVTGGIDLVSGNTTPGGTTSGAIKLQSGAGILSSGDVTLISGGALLAGGFSGTISMTTGGSDDQSGRVILGTGSSTTTRSGHIVLTTGPSVTPTTAGEVVVGEKVQTDSGKHVIVEQLTPGLATNATGNVQQPNSSDVAGQVVILPNASSDVIFTSFFSFPPFVVISGVDPTFSLIPPTLQLVSTDRFRVRNQNGVNLTVNYHIIGGLSHV